MCKLYKFKGAMSRLNRFSLINFSILLFVNPCQSSPSLTILVPLWFTIISLVFFCLCNHILFSGFLQFKGKFVDSQNTSKYRDTASLKVLYAIAIGLDLIKYAVSTNQSARYMETLL